MLEAVDTESRDRFEPVTSGAKWPDVMSKAAYGRYRKARFDVGTPAAVTGWIKNGKITAPALRIDGKINRELADTQLAARRDPARVAAVVADELPYQTGEAEIEDDPADAQLLAGNAAYADVKTALAQEQLRAKKIQNNIAEGRYVDAASVRRAMVDMARATRDRILAVSPNVAGALVGKDEREIATILTAALKATLTKMAETPPEES